MDHFWVNIKCAGCFQTVEKPVQLPACFHILCLECEKNSLVNTHNIRCPKCGTENARPEILQLISGIEETPGEKVLCDNSDQHEIAQWFCFKCGKNLCSSCRLAHRKDHKIQILVQAGALKRKIQEQANGDVPDATTSNNEAFKCPLCRQADCKHLQKLRELSHLPDVGNCQQQGHVDTELKYFCQECWVPVCGDCSHKGKHKQHECDDMSTCGQEFVTKSLAILKETLNMLIVVSKQNVAKAESDEVRFNQHVDYTEQELNSRKLKILQDTESAFDSAIKDAELQGRSILTDCKEKLNQLQRFQCFLLKIEETLNNFTISANEPTIEQNVRAFHLLQLASKLVSEMQREYQCIESPQERQLVLPQIEVNSIPPPTLARVGTEWKKLQLAYFFKFDEQYRVRSIVLTGSDTCLLSTKSLTGQSHYDSIVQYHYNSNTHEAECNIYDTCPGTYYLSQLPSGEIVASYRYPKTSYPDAMHQTPPTANAIKYFSRLPAHNSHVLEMKVIKEFQFPPCSIATTKDNNILLCVNADEKKNLSYLILMNLLGNELKSTIRQPGPNMISPNYVAVSSSGEICISDTEGSSIAILDENLTVKERVNYQLPTSVKNASNYKFQPHGICYDSYGRIIVADPQSSCVLRLARAPKSTHYKLEPLLLETAKIPQFRQPKLVAMGKDSRLWVVCAEHILVFNYVA